MKIEGGAITEMKVIFKRKFHSKKLMENELPQLMLNSVQQGAVYLKISEAGVYQGQSSEFVIVTVHYG